MENLTLGELVVETTASAPDAPLLFFLTGRSVDRYPAKSLCPYLSRAIDEAQGLHVPVELHFEKLAHFNSSTIAAVIQVIHEARRKSVKLVLTYDHSAKWQRISFDALRVFSKADDLFALQPIGGAPGA